METEVESGTRVTERSPSPRVSAGGPFSFRVLAEALYLHHWVKNLLVFAPIVAAHRVGDVKLLLEGGILFLAFGLSASAAYLFNDLVDLDSDRSHPTKRRRPLASGRFPRRGSLALIPALMLSSLGLAFLLLPIEAPVILGCYLVVNAAYSLFLKRQVMVDVVVLASFYTLRVIAGGAVTGIPMSDWFLAFSTFLFCSLAFVKRYSELHRLEGEAATSAPGRGYRVSDQFLILGLGVATGSLATLVMALYLQSREVELLYREPRRLWILCPLAFYWIARLWFKASRGEVLEDPVVFMMRDKVSYLVLALGLGVLLWAKA